MNAPARAVGRLQLALEHFDKAGLDVIEFAVDEGLSRPFVVKLTATCKNPSLDLEQALAAHASFTIETPIPRPGGSLRVWQGMCVRAALVRAEPTGLSHYHFEIAPRLWQLQLESGYAIYQHRSIPEICATVFEKHGVEPSWEIDRAAYPRLEYVCQYDETDYAFVHRLLETAGICYWFEARGEEASVFRLSDAPATRAARPTLPFVDRPNDVGLEYVERLEIDCKARAGSLSLRDHDPRNPVAELGATAALGPEEARRYEHYHYRPGAFLRELDLTDGSRPTTTPVADRQGNARHDKAYGERLALVALSALRRERRSVRFDTNALSIAPGTVVTVDHHPHPDLPVARRLLVTSLSAAGRDIGQWKLTAQAAFADLPYRPEQHTPKPRVTGVQSAVVITQGETAAASAAPDIDSDELGRILVRFPWDLAGEKNGTGSCRARVSEGWAGAGFGWNAVPRAGEEVLVAFEDGDPDRPIVVGRLYNELNPVPYKLPEERAIAGWKTRSTPGAANGFNELAFDDTAGKELLRVRAERDMTTLVKRDENLLTQRHRKAQIAGNSVDGSAKRRVQLTAKERIEKTGGSRTTFVAGERLDLVKGARSERTEGDLRTLVAKDRHAIVAKDRLERVDHDDDVIVKGASNLHVGGDRSLTIGGDSLVEVGGSRYLESDGEVHIIAGVAVFEAMDVILSGGGGVVRVNPLGVTIKGPLVKLNEGGSAGSGKGSSPKAPQEPAAVEIALPADDTLELPEEPAK